MPETESQPVEGAEDPAVVERRRMSGFIALCLVASVHQRDADPVQLVRALGLDGQPLGDREIALAARELDLRAKAARVSWNQLTRLSTPLIAGFSDGGYGVITQAAEGRVFVMDLVGLRHRWIDQAEFEQAWSGQVVLVKAPVRLTDPNRRFDLKWFIPIVWKYRHAFREILLASFVIQLFALATPLFTQLVIDKVLVHNSIPTLDVLALGMLIIIVFEGTLNLLQTYLLAHTSNRVDVTVDARVMHHLLRLPLRYFEARRVGNTVAHVRELDHIRKFLTSSSVTVLIDLLFIGVFLAVMCLYSIPLTLLVVGVILILVVLTLVLRPLMRTRLDEKFDRGAESNAYLVESVTGIQTIKSMGIEPLVARRWEILLARYVNASFRATTLGNIGGVIGQTAQRLATLAILWVGAYQVMEGHLTVGELIAFQMLAMRAIAPVMRTVKMWQDFQQVGVSIDRVGDILNARAERFLSPGKVALPAIQGRITVERLRFRFHADGPAVIQDLCLDIPAGTTVGVVGRSGSGKSTFAKLLQRLYLPEAGRILIDGLDLQQVNPLWLRRQLGVVLQENILFNGTVRENIAIHMPGTPMTRILEVARLAGADEFISGLPEGYDTPVGERGMSLSGGQRQRIAIARALLGDPRILILDEATSALDSESEQIIRNNLGQICKGRTVLMIAHRLSTIRYADQIIVIDQGSVAEQGTHDELLARNGIYASLFRIQHDAPPEGRRAAVSAQAVGAH